MDNEFSIFHFKLLKTFVSYVLLKLLYLPMRETNRDCIRDGCIPDCFVGVVSVGWKPLCLSGLHVDKLASFLALGEDNYTVDESEESVVLAHTHVETGVVNCATLTLDDVTGFAMLTAENLYTESFAF